MEPVVNKILQGIPFAGMGTELERNGLIGVVRNLIKANKYTVDYILNYCESVGSQSNLAEEVFEELTGISPKLIINKNEYYDAPIYVPACTIAWGLAKTKPNVAFYVVPGSYGYSVMEKNETDVPAEVIQTATIPEAIDELKKVAKKIQTLDKIITSKLLETEDVATIATDPNQIAKPYAAVDPVFELKKNFKNKVIDINGFEREAKRLVAEEKISLEDAEDLLNWEQDIINEDEYYANEVLQNNEEWKPLEAVEDIPFEKIYNEFLAISAEDEDILGKEDKAKKLYTQNKSLFKDCDLLQCAERLYQLMLGFNKEEILGHSKYVDRTENKLNKKAYKKVKSSPKIIQVDVYNISWDIEELDEENLPKEKLPNSYKNLNIEIPEFTENIEELIHESIPEELKNEFGYVPSYFDWSYSKKKASLKKLMADKKQEDYNKAYNAVMKSGISVDTKIKGNLLYSLFEEIGFDSNEVEKMDDSTFNYYVDLFDEAQKSIFRKHSSKKVTAENITLEDMEEEDNKSESEKEVEKINETPIDELLEDNTPLDFFEKETQDDKVDTINDIVSKCITEFSDKFKDFNKYDIKMLSYKTKILDPYTPTQDEMIPDNEVNADAVLQVILGVNNKADESAVKKLLVVFSITDGKMHWTGTVRDEDNNIVAFTEEGLDSIFNEPEEITEDII